MTNFSEILLQLLQGFGVTLELFAITLVLALPLGLLICFGSRSKFLPLKGLCRGFVWIIRSTPLMLQILFVSLIPRYVFGVLTKDVASFLHIEMKTLNFVFVAFAFVINYACYFSEIYRGAIDSIPKGQYEAGKVLGLTKSQIFFKIILFQMIKRVMTPMSNEIITLVKDTSLAQIVGVIDLLSAAQKAVNTYVVLTPFIYAIVFYLVFNGLLTVLFGYIEKKMSFYKE